MKECFMAIYLQMNKIKKHHARVMSYDGAWLQLDSRERAKTLPNAKTIIAEIGS